MWLFCGSPSVAQVKPFDVPAQDAGKSVPELARQAGIQVIAPGDQLHGIVTPPVKGTYDVIAALNLMLKGTGLVVSRSADGIVTISLPETKGQGEREEMLKGQKNSVSTLALLLGVFAIAPANAQSDQQLETVVVTGIRATMAQGLDIKRQSTQVVESIIAEDIGKLPDNNVVEALQRLSGVQVTNRGSGQVGTISIRGLTDIETTWNGRKMFTSSGLYYSVQDMPATLVRRLDVYKTRESNQLETGIAGQIDVASYRPFDFEGFKFTAQAKGTYEEKRGATDPSLGFLISDRWRTSIGDVGVLANVSWSVVRFRDESSGPGALVPFMTEKAATGFTPLERIFNTDARVTESPIWQPGLIAGLPEAAGSTMKINGVSTPYYLSRDAIFQSDFTGKRTRPNANVAFQWSPNDHATYTLEMMYNGYRNETYNNLLFSFVDWWGDFAGTTPSIAPASSYTLYSGTNVMKTRHVGDVYDFNSGDMTVSKTNTYAYALNAKWVISDRLNLGADASFQTSQYDSQFFAMRIDRVAPEINVDFNSGGGIMAFNFGSTQNRLTDPSYWNTAQLYDNANHNKGNAYTFQFDGTYDTKGIAGVLQNVKFGLRYDDRNSTEAYRQASGYHSQNFATVDKGMLHYNSGFFDGVGAVPSSWVDVDGRYIYEHRNDLRTLYGGDLTSARLHEMFETFKIDEMTTTAYLEGNFEQEVAGRPLTLNAGVRWVQVKDGMTFFDHTQFLVDGSHNQTNGNAYAAKFLPSATLAYEPLDDVKIRLNYGETLRRPDFTALNPTYILNADVTKVGYATGTRGNPDLKPTHAKNIDLSAEWYFAPSSAIYGTVFRRDLEGIVVNENVSLVMPGAAILNSYNTNNFIINMPMNASAGNLKGIELGMVYFPDFLPSFADGFGFQGSLTILSSSQLTPQTDTTGKVVSELKQNMFGVSNMSYNTTLIYEKNDFGARLSYVWRSKFLNANEAASFANPLGIWRRAESSFDAQMNYKIWDGVMVTFDAVNLLNAKQKQYYHAGGQGDQDITDFGTALFSRTFTVGLHYSTN